MCNTYFVYEDGSWRHRFSQEEYELFMPDAPTRSSLRPNRTFERGFRSHGHYHRERLVQGLLWRSPRSLGSLRG